MKTFRSLAEVDAARLPPKVHDVVYRVVKDIVDAYTAHGGTYDPDAVGYTILIQRGDTNADVEREVGYNLREALFEGVLFEGGCFVTCTLHSNEYGVSWILPDEPWLEQELRAKLAAEYEEGK